jgi:hypothetical protein
MHKGTSAMGAMGSRSLPSQSARRHLTPSGASTGVDGTTELVFGHEWWSFHSWVFRARTFRIVAAIGIFPEFHGRPSSTRMATQFGRSSSATGLSFFQKADRG